MLVLLCFEESDSWWFLAGFSDNVGHILSQCTTVVVPVQCQEGSIDAFLMVSTRGQLLVLGGNPLHGSDTLDSRMGTCLWDLSLGQRTGDGRFDGETFFGCVVDFFLGGRGGKTKRQGTVSRVGRWTATYLQTVAKGVLDLYALDRHVSSSGFDIPST
jgi:hypothetical protein